MKSKTLTITEAVFKQNQLVTLVQTTPSEHVRERKGRGGKNFKYVTGSYVQSVLNRVFGWGWSFEVKNHGLDPAKTGVWVLGKLTVLDPATRQPMIIKEQFGSSEIKKMREGGLVDYADDLKSATTDALKKCASLLGVAADIYADPEVAAGIEETAAATAAAIIEARKQKKEEEEKEKLNKFSKGEYVINAK